MSPKLSSTLAGMTLLEFPFLLLVLGPLVGQRFVTRLALEDAAPALDERSGDGFEENSLRRRLHHDPCPVLDFKLLSQAQGNHHLPFGREPGGFSFLSHIHRAQYDS